MYGEAVVSTLTDKGGGGEKGNIHMREAAQAFSQTEGEPVRRLNVNLPASRLQRLQVLAKRRGGSMTDIVRWALSLVERVLLELENGNRIVVVNSKGKIEKEIIIPM